MRVVFPRMIRLPLVLVAAFAFHACATETAGSLPRFYVDSADPMLDVQIGLDKAKSADKLLLVVMGAQWCHDSRALAEKFRNPEVAKILQADYETVFVDVGYFKDLRAISRRFDQAHYFATPTVMIINPHTGRLINAGDMHIWGSAGRLPVSRYVEYFSVYAENSSPPFTPLPDEHASAIARFERENGERLTKAYEVLVPGMQLEDRTGKAGQEFLQQWREVRSYRTALQRDIQSVRRQAIDAPGAPLELPAYERFSWEHDFPTP